jgi:hypothetical protein
MEEQSNFHHSGQEGEREREKESEYMCPFPPFIPYRPIAWVWCYPHSGWVFPYYLILSENALIDTPTSVLY